MTFARQQHTDIRAPRPFSEPEEREDPRNALLDAFDEHIDALIRHELVPQLVARIEHRLPEIARRIAAECPATIVQVPPSPADIAAADQAAIEAAARNAPLAVAAVLTALKLVDGLRMSNAHRALIDGAKATVLGWITSPDAARQYCEPSALPVTIGIWDMDSAGSNEA